MLTPSSPPGVSYGLLPRPCRALVLLNPQSGAGRALEDFQAVVQPMLADADIAATVFVTGESPQDPPPAQHPPGMGSCGAAVTIPGWQRAGRRTQCSDLHCRETPPRSGEGAG